MTSLRAGRRALALVLLVVLQLQACRGQGTAELRKPIYQRLRRLDDQFRRFQEQTLSRLDLLNRMSNVSTSLVEVRVQTLSDQHRNLTQELTQLRDTTTQELDVLKDQSSKLQKKNKRMEGRLASLERGLRHRQGQGSRQTQRLSQEQEESLSSLTLELHSQEGRLDSLEAQREELLVGLRGLQESLREQDLRMSRLELRLGELLQGNVISSRGSERTGNTLTSNLTPQDTAPPRRTQASRGQSPRQDTQTYYQPQPQANIQPQPYSQPHPQPHSQPKHTKERRMRTRLQAPPPHPTQPPSQSQEERKRLGERGQESPRPGLPQQGPKPQSVEETREEGEMERRRGDEVWRRSEVTQTEMRRGEEERTERRRGEEERTERRKEEEERTERRKEEEEQTERRKEEEEMKGEESQIQNLLQLPVRHKIPLQHIPRREATICNVDSMLLFPSASSENHVTFSRSFPALPELSVCLWLRVDVGYVGTLLSYATEDNDNKLVLYGRNSSSSSFSTPSRATLDFVVGDPAYRELPVDSVLDGCWHHLCVLWSSIQGRFWHYTDRRLTSAGSRFRKGYEVPGGGIVVLGAEQDSQGGGFDPTEGFVGRLAGFTVWDRVLSPGEVTGVAMGRGVPRGVVLELGDVDRVHGEVQQVACECLEHCS
ncbi:pentraxin-4 [Oncorhynchus mykiss]|uniref:Pentraxin 4, long n=1 Tax=Oncorhynchus mykiss TaxID=8022 RepID=A0A8C7VA14_ONCMY|nr:pentraxin-4 [Oncorhynchus mykiss]